MQKVLAVLGVIVMACLAFVHWILPGTVEAKMNVVLSHDAYTISDRTRELHQSLFVADLHSDSLLWKRDLARRSDTGHMDIPRLIKGNVALQVFSATTKSPKGQNYARNEADSDRITLLAVLSFWPLRTWSSLYERALYQLQKLHAFAEDERLMLIRSRSDLEELTARRAAGEQLVGAIYLIEGAHPFEGDIANVDRLFNEGLRISGLTHFFDNELGGSLHGTSGEGLTEFGRAVVRRANELGMIIDIAHASPAMVADVLDLSSSPVILSHGGFKGSCDTPRNLSDDLMQRIADAGGLIGVGYWDGAICDASPQGIVDSIRYGIDLLGVDHIALGSDYDGTVTVPFDTSELAILTETMLQSGFTEDEVHKVMGENARRFMLQNLPSGS
jgi:microsomal dipeptidase-like Zn-dependent dipeptidase